MLNKRTNTLMEIKKINEPRVIIYGAGAVGLAIGGWLSSVYENNFILARGENARSLKTFGLTLYQKGRKKPDPIAVTVITDLCEKPDAQIIIISVKNYNLEEAAEDIFKKFGDTPIIVALQNGIANQEILPRYFSKIIYGIVSFNSWIDERGIAGYTEKGEVIFGTLSDELQAVTEKICRYFNHAFPARYTHKLKNSVHSKMVINLGNSVMTLFNYTDLDYESVSLLKKVFINVMKEGIKIVKAAGCREEKSKGMPSWTSIKLLEFLPGRISDILFKKSIERIGPNSMVQDVIIHNRDQTELEYLNGYFINLADSMKIPAPYNRAIYRMCKRHFSEPGFKPLDIKKVQDEISLLLQTS